MMMCALLSVWAAMDPTVAADAQFLAAKPVWLEGRETEKNLSVRFRAVFDAQPGEHTFLRVTASTLYRAYVNGVFVGHGPARAAQGFFRVDEWDLTPRLKPQGNVVAIEVAGYNANSYYLLDQPSFIQAEVDARDKVLAATGAAQGGRFEASVLSERVQKVQRYSFQRPFIEVYRFDADHARWMTDPAAPFAAAPCAEVAAKSLLPRRVAKPTFFRRPALWQVAQGTLEADPAAGSFEDRSLKNIGPKLGGYPEAELERVISAELAAWRHAKSTEVNAPVTDDTALDLATNTFQILDLGANSTGFLGATVKCTAPCRLYFLFDEILSKGDVDWRRMGCVAAITYDLPAGEFAIESFEPYTMRYVKALCVQGACSLKNVYLREYVNPDVYEAHFACNDPRINRLFEAGRRTFQQNAVDIFMDCPSRERAGWLCDSFFTSRVAYDLAGNTRVETNFIENFLLPKSFPNLPEGMLPMCYPSDHYDGVFIPNWAMWFVVELREYVARSGDRAMAEALKPKVEALLKYFERFRNSDGLLEKLESWVFVEWSKANDFTQDVNYPSNMLYAGVLDTAAELYGNQALRDEAERVRKAIRDQAFDGTFFVDNAVRKDGKLEVTKNHSEVCQYFAFFFNVATPETHADLWRKLLDEFGPKRAEAKLYPEVFPANSFIGNMLRFELLSRAGRGGQILAESVDYLSYMAERTGTLWENVDERASCNHGFASHIVHTLYRDVVGLYEVDAVGKRIAVRFTDVPLAWCEGDRPLPDGTASIRWRRDDAGVHYHVDAPAGYAIDIQNPANLKLIREP